MNVDLRYMHCPIFGVCANLSVHCNGYSLSLLKFGEQKSTLRLFHPQGAAKTGRDGPIRTGDPLVPNQMRYHAALHPVYEKRPAVTYALQGFFISLGRNARLELTAPWATTRCSAN